MKTTHRRTEVVKVSVRAGARRESCEKLPNGAFAISVREPARGGQANRRVRALIAEHFDVPVNAVRIASGHRYLRKTLSVHV